MNASWKFVVEAMPIAHGKQLKALKPNNVGYYSMPLMSFSNTARSGIYYRPEPIINAIKSPQSAFNIKLTDSNLMGCINHPLVLKKEDIPILLEIDQRMVSHHFKKIYCDESNGTDDLLMSELKPWGPYGSWLEESLQDPYVNTAFSIRSLCKQTVDPKTHMVYRDVEVLVTFDWVHAPGYREASKRYAPGLESLSSENFTLDVTPEDFVAAVAVAGCESIRDSELMRVFGMTKFELNDIRGEYTRGNKSFIGEDGNRHSLVHALLGA